MPHCISYLTISLTPLQPSPKLSHWNVDILMRLDYNRFRVQRDNQQDIFELVNGIADITQNNLTAHGKKIRVFNEDFVKDNLRFIANSDENITPFAIIGGNATIEGEIQTLKDDLGNSEVGSESGFYLELKNATTIANTAFQSYQTENNQLDQQLTTKALDRATGIKYKSERFGDQNYTKAKLISDIEIVLEASFKPLTDDEIIQKSNFLNERANPDIPAIAKPKIGGVRSIGLGFAKCSHAGPQHSVA